jgi:uncharacterized protein
MTDLTNKIALRALRYYAETDVTQIAHTQCVVNYTQLIAFGENYPLKKQELIEIAAWLHDIGCPVSKEKYGNSRPMHQMEEGFRITTEWLKDYPQLTTDEQAWIAHVVGGHHQLRRAKQYGFEALYEADIIVNFFEGYYKKINLKRYFDCVMTSRTGRELYKTFFFR